MNTLVIVLLAGAATAQRFAAVQLARPGFFRQDGSQLSQNSFSSESVQEGNFEDQRSQFQSSSSFDGSVSSQNQFKDAQFQTRSFSDNQEQSSQFQSGFSSQNQGQFVDESGTTGNSVINGEFEPLNLPSGASLLLGNIDTSFQCADRPYGFYADQGNDCRVFHVCNPYLFEDGRVETYQYSFMCGEGRIFDQEKLTCDDQFVALPCAEAVNFYFRNEEFGRAEEKL
ncbi:uncharacterized protein LOC143021377 [Oratosquilla oratoria]|uniref:uncharacterized protein LOC143021377 n=1 Tax=Oratosquilla oratoria TaxID=337810 RepID=UPI003F76BA5B